LKLREELCALAAYLNNYLFALNTALQREVAKNGGAGNKVCLNLFYGGFSSL